MKLKIIKFKAFDTNGVKGVNYTCAYKGRVFNVSSLPFEEGDLVANKENTVLDIKCHVDAVQGTYMSPEGLKPSVHLMPKLDLVLTSF